MEPTDETELALAKRQKPLVILELSPFERPSLTIMAVDTGRNDFWQVFYALNNWQLLARRRQ